MVSIASPDSHVHFRRPNKDLGWCPYAIDTMNIVAMVYDNSDTTITKHNNKVHKKDNLRILLTVVEGHWNNSKDLINIWWGSAHAYFVLQSIRYRFTTEITGQIDRTTRTGGGTKIGHFYLQFSSFLPKTPRIQAVHVTKHQKNPIENISSV